MASSINPCHGAAGVLHLLAEPSHTCGQVLTVWSEVCCSPFPWISVGAQDVEDAGLQGKLSTRCLGSWSFSCVPPTRLQGLCWCQGQRGELGLFYGHFSAVASIRCCCLGRAVLAEPEQRAPVCPCSGHAADPAAVPAWLFQQHARNRGRYQPPAAREKRFSIPGGASGRARAPH